MKLWEKGYDLNKDVEKYTVGDDFKLDKALIRHDCAASIAHSKVLLKAGVLNGDEQKKLEKELDAIIGLDKQDSFEISIEDEDCHTAIEKHLVKKLGSLGKKIHAARSRNDQSAAALRLYMIEKLEETKQLIVDLIASLDKKMQVYPDVVMPGFTHMRKATPSSVKIWLGSFAASMADNKTFLESVQAVLDQNPLGSGAGYGLPVFDIDRKLSAKELGFSRVQEPLFVQNSRGKFEGLAVSAMSSILLDLNRLASDLMLFSMPEFGYVVLPKEICTGSSMMPQKMNPDVLEILRAKYHEVLAAEFQIKSTLSGLISGYNRDYQLTKKPMMESFDAAQSSLKMMILVVEKLSIEKDACKAAMSDELYATEEAYKLVNQGVPFRDAYEKVGRKFS